ncbi:hypothetical protein [Streptomyces sp. NPDC058304]|uniref:hypothetical protein n=1 Tax=Streptomyces sp. NPDC058304 TaxID=3346437 RepID=UPI0036E815FC
MSRRRPVLPRWFGSVGRPEPVPPAAAGRPAQPDAPDSDAPDADPPGTYRLGGTVLLYDPAASPEEAGTLRALAARVEPVPHMPTLLIAVPDSAADALWPALGAELRRLTDEGGDEAADGEGGDAVRLVMSGAAAVPENPEQAPLAQQLADAWQITVVAPDAPAVVTPGGALFVTAPATPGGGWWQCDPGRPPTALGQRHPAPVWQPAIARIGTRQVGDSVAEQIPAGLLLRPGRAPAPAPGDLAFAVPADADRPTLLVGSPDHEPVPAEDVAALLSALPVSSRRALRLAPADHRDLLPTARAVADLLDDEVEVLTGLPLATARRTQVLVCAAEGTGTWRPFVESVSCRPVRENGTRPADEPMSWRTPPVRASRPTGDGSLDLGDGWQVRLTRWGLWFAASDSPPPPDLDTRPVNAAAPVLAVSGAGAESAQDATFWPALTDVLDALEPDFRELAVLTVEGPFHARDHHALRRLAAARQVTLSPAAPTGPGETPAPDRGPLTEAGVGPGLVLPAEAGVGTDAGRDPGRRSAPALALAAPSVSDSASAAPLVAAPAMAPAAASAQASNLTSASASVSAAASESPSAMADGGSPDQPPAPASASGVTPGPAPCAEPVRSTAPTPITTSSLMSAPLPATTAEAPVSPFPAAAEPMAVGPLIVPGVPRGGVPLTEVLATPHLRPQSGAAGAVAVTSDGPVPVPVPVPAPDPAGTGGESVRPAATISWPVPACTADHRHTFRESAGSRWERHTGAVSRAMIHMPALRTRDENAAKAELVAAHLFLSSGDEDTFGATALREGMRQGDPATAAYWACLNAGLRRLPAYRGPVLRAWEPDTDPVARQEPGGWILVEEPVAALPVAVAEQLLPAALGRYAVRTTSGRRTGALFGGTDAAGVPERIVILPGTRLYVCAAYPATGELPARLLLNETPSGATGSGRSLPAAEALSRLEDAACRGTVAPSSAGTWPRYCTGHLGSYLPASPATAPVTTNTLESRSSQ